MKKLFWIFLIVFSSNNLLICQDYQNRTFNLPIGILGSNVLNSSLVNGDLLIATYHTTEDNIWLGGLYVISPNGNHVFYQYSDIVCGLDCIIYHKDIGLYLHGTANASENESVLLKLDNDYSINWIEKYEIDVNRIVNYWGKTDGKNIYLSSLLVKSEEPKIRHVHLQKIDPSGNLEFGIDTEFERPLYYPWETFVHDDEGILTTAKMVDEEFAIGYSQIRKFDSNGDQEWELILDEPMPNGATHLFVDQLSDSNYIIHSERNRMEGEHMNYLDPAILYLLDENGNHQGDTTLLSPITVEPTIEGIVAGDSDYFFVYGTEFDHITDISYGVIWKFSSDLEQLWKRRYRHPDHLETSFIINYRITNLIEEENGNLITTGQIVDYDKNENVIWVMNLSHDGCLDNNGCQDEVITSTHEYHHSILQNEILVYSNQIHLSELINDDLELIEVCDLMGRVVVSTYNLDCAIDISHLPFGAYLIRLNYSSGFSQSLLKYHGND